MVLTGQPRRAMKNTACQTPTAMSAEPKSGAGDGAARIAQPGGGALGGWYGVEVDEQEVGADPDRPGQCERGDAGPQPSDAAQRPALADQRQLEHGGERRAGQGQRRGKRRGNAGTGVASKTPRTSGRSTMAWPAMVSTIAAATTRPVSIRPVQGVVSLEPGQSFHQNAIMATAGSANVEIGPRISSDVSVLPVPRARAKKTTALSSRPPSPSHGCAARRWRCRSATPGAADAAGWSAAAGRAAAARRRRSGGLASGGLVAGRSSG